MSQTTLSHEHWTHWLKSVNEKQYFGHWCRYEPTGKLITCFNAERIFIPSGEGTVHRNIYHYPTGTAFNGPWEIMEEECSKNDGIAHPARFDVMRTLVVPSGAGAWLTPTFKSGSSFGAEMFLFHGQFLRMSIIAMHDADGNIGNVNLIREDTRGHSTQSPSPDWTTCTDCMRATPKEVIGTMLTHTDSYLEFNQGHVIFHNLTHETVHSAHINDLLYEFARDDFLILFDENAVALILPKKGKDSCSYVAIWRISQTLHTIQVSWRNRKLHHVKVLQFNILDIGPENQEVAS